MIRLSRATPALAALLLLAACARTPQTAGVPPAPENPEVAACRAESRGAGQTRDAGRQVNFNNPNQMDRVRQMEADAEARAFNDCLRRRGVVRGGGVEPLRRPGFAF